MKLKVGQRARERRKDPEGGTRRKGIDLQGSMLGKRNKRAE